MKSDCKKALAVLLFVIMTFGTVAVGGEGFSQVLDAISVIQKTLILK